MQITIQIKHRPYWIGRVDKCIQKILEIRAKKDKKYEENWRKRSWIFKNKSNEKPPVSNDLFNEYPSLYAHNEHIIFKRIQIGLLNTNCGDILLTGEELELIEVWEN